MKSKKKWVLADAPVGSGKTALAAYVSKFHKVLSLVELKSLQEQYVKYGFTSLPGKNEFNCSNFYNRYPAPKSAEKCLFSRLKVCGDGCGNPLQPANPKFEEKYCNNPARASFLCKDNCEYPWAKDMFLSSIRGVTNYTKYLVDKSIRDYDKGVPQPDILFLDEAHKLVNILTDWKSNETKLPYEVATPIPITIGGVERVNYRACFQALKDARAVIQKQEPSKATAEADPDNFIKWSRKFSSISAIVKYINKENIEADKENRPTNVFYEVAGDTIISKFLTPDLSVFDPIKKVVLMTATSLGIMDDLGLDEDEVDIIKVPSAFTSKQRRIWTFEESPKLGYKDFKNKTCKFHQLVSLIKLIMDAYSEWTGIAHFASYRQCEDAYDALKGAGYNLSCFLPQGMPTNQQMDWWEKKKGQGIKLCLTPVWSEGVDLPDENINLICKIYYPPAFQEGTFLTARRLRNKRAYSLGVARTSEQRVGRTQRGVKEHYGPENSFVAILDKNINGLLKFHSEDFKSRLKVWADED